MATCLTSLALAGCSLSAGNHAVLQELGRASCRTRNTSASQGGCPPFRNKLASGVGVHAGCLRKTDHVFYSIASNRYQGAQPKSNHYRIVKCEAVLEEGSSPATASTIPRKESVSEPSTNAVSTEAPVPPTEAEEAPDAPEPPLLSQKELRVKLKRSKIKARRGKGQKVQWVKWGWDGVSSKDEGALEKWLQREGLPPQKVALQPVSEGGRGLVAKERIGKGETLLYVPEKALITLDSVHACPRVGAVVKAAGVPDWPALAVYLVSEAARGPASNWFAYIDALPRKPVCILTWDLEEVDDLLEGSPIRQKAIECIAEVNDTYRDLQAELFSKHPDVFPKEVFTAGAFNWAFAILFSRLVRLPSAGNRLALVPWGDMLNHKCEATVHLDWDQGRRAVVLKADREYSAGQQVHASYGARSTGELLLAYGIVPAGRNPSDAVELLLGLSSDDPLLAAKQAALRPFDISSLKTYPVKMEGIPSQLLAYAQLVAAGPSTSKEVLSQLAAASASTIGEKPNDKLVKRTLEEEIEAREIILAACQQALSGYSTTVEEDDLLASEIAEEDMEVEEDKKALAAASLRKSERRILYRTDFVLRAELRDLRNVESSKDGKAKIDFGNNFGGRKNTGILNAILSKIARP